MVRTFLAILALGLAAACASVTDDISAAPTAPKWSLAIHGGAGVILRENLSPEDEAAIRERLQAALDAGSAILAAGGTSLDAVTAAIIVLEDAPQFNAGKGAVLTAAGTHELDASIMVGRDRNAGAVAGVTGTRNPILAARAVMEQSEHVFFAGPGADRFAVSVGLEQVPNSYFTTPERKAALDRVLESRARSSADKAGTVGAVAIDQYGDLAAGTSTGGMTAKATGRVGDSPMIGAATYAQNGVCAVSATGHGEFFIRVAVAKTICTRIEMLGETAEVAATNALAQVAELGGDGGVIVMDAEGSAALVFDTPGMYRGTATPEGSTVEIYGDAQ